MEVANWRRKKELSGKSKYRGELKLHTDGPITSWEIDGETVETVRGYIFLGSKITADGDCSHEIKRHLLLGRKSYDQPKYSKAEVLLCQQRSV